MTYCSKCGKEIETGNFCPYCGTPLDDTVGSPTEPLNVSESLNSNKKQENTHAAPDGMYFNAYDSLNSVPGKSVPIEDGKNDNKKMIRKILILVSIVACFLIAVSVLTPKLKVEPTATTAATTTAATTSTPTSTWQEYKFNINGLDMSLPINFTDFTTATGFNFVDEASAGTQINPGDIVPIIVGKDGTSTITIYLKNEIGEAITPDRSVVCGIEADENSNIALGINGINLGTAASVENIQTVLGKENDGYSASNDFYSLTYFQNNDENNVLEIHLSAGKVNYFHLVKAN